MSDEMVQEKTETAAVVLENGQAGDNSSVEAVVETVSSVAPSPVGVAEEPVATPSALLETSVAPDASASETPEEAVPAGGDTFEQAIQSLDIGSQYDESFRQLVADKVVTGTVMRVDREGVLVDVGAKSEGIIRLNELTRDPGPNLNPETIVQVGDKIRVYVLEPENQDGIPVLSKKRADFEQAWETLKQSKESGEIITAVVSDRVKGGLVVDLGIRGFVPASHVGSGSPKNNLDKFVGQSIPLKVLEVDKERRKIILSHKLAVQEERENRSQETKASLEINQVRRGVVRRLTNYGAFVDLGGIDGLLHISEMSWTRINDPKEVLKEGQEVDVMILKIDLQNNRVSLGMRQIQPDPWQQIVNVYKEGDVLTGTVTRVVPFGAFVRVEGNIEGIIPNMEMPRSRGGKGGPTVAVNEEVTAKIILLKPDERKMTLSLRALAGPEEMGGDRGDRGGDRGDGSGSGRGDRPPQTSVESGGSGGGGNKRKRVRDRDQGENLEDYSRYSRQEEPRFTIGDAFAAAQRRDKQSKRERRTRDDYEEELDDFDYTEEVENNTTEVEGSTDT